MPTSRFNVSLAAGAANNQVLDGSLYEVIRQAGTMVVAAVCDAAAAANTQLITVLIDSDTVMEESPVPSEVVAGTGPNLQDHVLVREEVVPGDKVTIRVRNSDVATRNTRILYSVP